MSVRDRVLAMLTTPVAEAHCDGPCGVYDPASARIAAEAVLSMTKKMLDLHVPEGDDETAWAGYLNTMSRFAAIKEDQAEKAKHEIVVLWTDYFNSAHLEAFPELHETFWNAAKLCSRCKQNVDIDAGEQLLAAVEKIHKMFWESKNRDVSWVPAVS